MPREPDAEVQEKPQNGHCKVEGYWDNTWNSVLTGLCYWIWLKKFFFQADWDLRKACVIITKMQVYFLLSFIAWLEPTQHILLTLLESGLGPSKFHYIY